LSLRSVAFKGADRNFSYARLGKNDVLGQQGYKMLADIPKIQMPASTVIFSSSFPVLAAISMGMDSCSRASKIFFQKIINKGA